MNATRITDFMPEEVFYVPVDGEAPDVVRYVKPSDQGAFAIVRDDGQLYTVPWNLLYKSRADALAASQA